MGDKNNKAVEVVVRSVPVAVTQNNAEFLELVPPNVRCRLLELLSDYLERLIMHAITHGELP